MVLTNIVKYGKKYTRDFEKEVAMSREWQQTKEKEYVLPDAVYYQSLWAVRDLYRMEERLNEINGEKGERGKSGSVVRECSSTGTLWKPTEDHAMEKVNLEERISAIRNALSVVPEYYRTEVLDNIIMKNPGTSYNNKVWRQWKQRFLFHVAKNLSIF